MSVLSNDELKQRVEAVFGTTLSDAEIESGKGRLPTMLENARLLAGWAERLGTTCPSQVLQVAQVLQVTETQQRKAGADD